MDQQSDLLHLAIREHIDHLMESDTILSADRIDHAHNAVAAARVDERLRGGFDMQRAVRSQQDRRVAVTALRRLSSRIRRIFDVEQASEVDRLVAELTDAIFSS